MRNIPGIVFHKEYLDETASWWRMSAVEQLGNIGSEVGRSLAAKASGDSERFEGASHRMYELFDLAMADARWRGKPALREICRARDVTSEFLFGNNAYGETAESLERYFLAYGIMANEERRKRRLKKKGNEEDFLLGKKIEEASGDEIRPITELRAKYSNFIQ